MKQTNKDKENQSCKYFQLSVVVFTTLY